MNKIRTIARYYGLEHQIRKAIEELGELVVALARDDRDNIVEEIADVMVMLMQLEILLDCDEEVFDIIEKKVERQIKRIRAEIADCPWRCP